MPNGIINSNAIVELNGSNKELSDDACTQFAHGKGFVIIAIENNKNRNIIVNVVPCKESSLFKINKNFDTFTIHKDDGIIVFKGFSIIITHIYIKIDFGKRSKIYNK